MGRNAKQQAALLKSGRDGVATQLVGTYVKHWDQPDIPDPRAPAGYGTKAYFSICLTISSDGTVKWEQSVGTSGGSFRSMSFGTLRKGLVFDLQRQAEVDSEFRSDVSIEWTTSAKWTSEGLVFEKLPGEGDDREDVLLQKLHASPAACCSGICPKRRTPAKK